MSELHSLESLQALHEDLLALSESRLSNVERLGIQLEAHIQDFRALLHKSTRNEQSRKSLETGKLDVDDGYSINEEFQQGAKKLADTLDLDELAAARIFLEVQEESITTGRSLHTCSIVRFHQRRKVLLECLRLVFGLAADVDGDEAVRDGLLQLIDQVVKPQGASNAPGDAQRYARKCLTSMLDIKKWLYQLSEILSAGSVTGQQLDFADTIEYQRASLLKQHELLSIIVFYLVKQDYTVLADFELVLETLKRADKLDGLLLHYFPVVSAYISRFGGQEERASISDARALNEKLLNQTDQSSWALTYVHAAFRAWWLAEYSGWYGEHYDGSLPQNQLEEESKQRSKQFTAALNDGAFEFILSLSAEVKSPDWHDPARHGLRTWLQRKVPTLSDSVQFSDFFQDVLMEQLESFIEGFITNLPDVLRKLRHDEDEQRQLNITHDHDLDLERFLVIISYTFEGRPKAALSGFWDVPDGVLIGFMQWASRRASTPLVSAFCEMLLAISEDEECGTAAHQFLLDEGSQSSGKMRKTHSLTWNQIFKELTYFSLKLRDRPAVPQTYSPVKHSNDHSELEPESFIMLESYLRLITQLCAVSVSARQFITQHPSFHLTELLFQLASSSIEPRLKACVFNALKALLTHKTKEAGDYLWVSLDVWISGGQSPGSNMPKTSISTPPSAASIERILRGLGNGFEEPNAFIQLLHTLVLPYDGDSGMHDGLPFPENLGASSRMPGIDPYIDFALGQVFGTQIAELNDIVHARLLQLTCLDFIATCLDSFNEDLVVFANRSSIMVDTAISASNLQTYVLLHPFSRVMEWMFNEKVMNTLFTAVHQDVAAVGSSAPDSPLVLCLLRGMHVLTSILDLQSTYLDIVRPLVKLQSTHRRAAVANAAFASFEDGILNHLYLIPDLGLYCGAGHSEVTMASLRLLEKLSASTKLISAPSTGPGRRTDRNKAIAALEANGDAEVISRALHQEIVSDIDINQGPASPTYIIKLQILDFLASSLRSSVGQPTIAHLFLGFQCSNGVLDVGANSSFDDGVSLFHAILTMVLEIPLLVGSGSVESWLVSLKSKGLQVLHQLWKAPLSSSLAMTEMRSHQSLFILFSKQDVISPGLDWNDGSAADPNHLLSTEAYCLSSFMDQRALMLQYASAELRQISHFHSPSLKKRVFATLLGSTTAENGEKVENPSVFDIFDFLELELNQPEPLPQLSWFHDMDLDACHNAGGDTLSAYNIKKVRELLLLRRAELEKQKRLDDPQNAALVDAQTEELVQLCAQNNEAKLLWASRLRLLRSWVQLVLLMIEAGDFEGPDKTSFILRTLRTIVPSLENGVENIEESMELARLAKSLIFSLEFDSASFKQGDMGDLISDRLFHLFQVSLKAINALGSNPPLKEIFYNISYRYLTGMSDVSGISGIRRRHSIQTIKAAGDHFIDLVCDDAQAGEPMCRVSALLLLCSLVKMARHDNSEYIIESLGRLNFIGILVDSTRNIADELRETARDEVELQLSCFHAKLALLLHISQARHGATAVLNAGLFHSVKLSGLFAVDPDLGVEINDPNASEKHYELLIAILRVICAVVLSRGPQNEQTLDQGRRFLADNRLSVLAVLKKSAGLGTNVEASMQSIGELADSYMLLMSFTGYLDFEGIGKQEQSLKAFT